MLKTTIDPLRPRRVAPRFSRIASWSVIGSLLCLPIADAEAGMGDLGRVAPLKRPGFTIRASTAVASGIAKLVGAKVTAGRLATRRLKWKVIKLDQMLSRLALRAKALRGKTLILGGGTPETIWPWDVSVLGRGLNSIASKLIKLKKAAGFDQEKDYLIHSLGQLFETKQGVHFRARWYVSHDNKFYRRPSDLRALLLFNNAVSTLHSVAGDLEL